MAEWTKYDSEQAILQAMRKHGMPMEALPWVMAVGIGESNLSPYATRENDNAELRARGIAAQPEASYGLFQLNVMGGRGTGYSKDQLYNPYTNADINMPALKKTWESLGGYGAAQSDPVGFLQTFYQRGQGSIPQEYSRAQSLLTQAQPIAQQYSDPFGISPMPTATPAAAKAPAYVYVGEANGQSTYYDQNSGIYRYGSDSSGWRTSRSDPRGAGATPVSQYVSNARASTADGIQYPATGGSGQVADPFAKVKAFVATLGGTGTPAPAGGGTNNPPPPPPPAGGDSTTQTTETMPDGSRWRLTWNPDGTLANKVQIFGPQDKPPAAASTYQATETAPDGSKWRITYDDQANIIAATQIFGAPAAGAQYTSGNFTNPDGSVDRVVFDASNNIVSRTQVTGPQAAPQPGYTQQTITDHNGTMYRLTFDERGNEVNRVAITGPAPAQDAGADYHIVNTGDGGVKAINKLTGQTMWENKGPRQSSGGGTYNPMNEPIIAAALAARTAMETELLAQRKSQEAALAQEQGKLLEAQRKAIEADMALKAAADARETAALYAELLNSTDLGALQAFLGSGGGSVVNAIGTGNNMLTDAALSPAAALVDKKTGKAPSGAPAGAGGTGGAGGAAGSGGGDSAPGPVSGVGGVGSVGAGEPNLEMMHNNIANRMRQADEDAGRPVKPFSHYLAIARTDDAAVNRALWEAPKGYTGAPEGGASPAPWLKPGRGMTAEMPAAPLPGSVSEPAPTVTPQVVVPGVAADTGAMTDTEDQRVSTGTMVPALAHGGVAHEAAVVGDPVPGTNTPNPELVKVVGPPEAVDQVRIHAQPVRMQHMMARTQMAGTGERSGPMPMMRPAMARPPQMRGPQVTGAPAQGIPPMLAERFAPIFARLQQGGRPPMARTPAGSMVPMLATGGFGLDRLAAKRAQPSVRPDGTMRPVMGSSLGRPGGAGGGAGGGSGGNAPPASDPVGGTPPAAGGGTAANTNWTAPGISAPGGTKTNPVSTTSPAIPGISQGQLDKSLIDRKNAPTSNLNIWGTDWDNADPVTRGIALQSYQRMLGIPVEVMDFARQRRALRPVSAGIVGY